MSIKYEDIEKELVTDLEVTTATRKLESHSILAVLEREVMASIEGTGIPVTDVALVSGAIRPGEGERTALFNVDVAKGNFPVGVVYTIAGSDVKVNKVEYPELKRAYNFSRYILEFNGEKYATDAKDKTEAVNTIISSLIEENGELIVAGRRYTKVNASLLKEAFDDSVQVDTSVVDDVVDDTSDDEPPPLVSASYVEREPSHPLRSVTASRKQPMHDLERIATDVFDNDIDGEVSQMHLASLSRQATSEIQEALEAIGLVGDVTANVMKADAEGKCTGIFDITSDAVSGKFEFTAKDNDGVLDKLDFDKTVLSQYSSFRDFQITLPESDRSFRISASNERAACLELLNHLEKTEGTISFNGKVVTDANREVVAEDMLERCAIVERNVHSSDTDGNKNMGNWKLQKSGEGMILVREE